MGIGHLEYLKPWSSSENEADASPIPQIYPDAKLFPSVNLHLVKPE